MDDIPKAVWSGSFTVLGVELKCHTLDNGQRIIEDDSMNAFFEAMENASDVDSYDWTGLEKFSRWQRNN